MTWRDSYREEYLAHILSLDGRGRFWGMCMACGTTPATYRCRDCVIAQPLCKCCVLQMHKTNPLHVLEVTCFYFLSVVRASPAIKEWRRSRFQRVTLKELGLRFQLGHLDGKSCPAVESAHIDFVVIASNGIHTINLDFCGCPGHPEQYVQLLEMRWWPSTPKSPRSAATMEVLRSFHILNLQARVPPTEFYRGLERLTDGQEMLDVPVILFDSACLNAG